MTTRFSAVDQLNNGISGIKSGYDTGLKSDLVIPSCGIEDVDVALFNLFDKEISPMTGGQDSADLKKVPVIFAAGEKWALLKNNRPIRDKTNTLILPLITIMRTGINQGPGDIVGRGINQQTGEIVVRRRLDSSDRVYQNLINKLSIVFQNNVSVNSGDPEATAQAITSRRIGEDETKVNGLRGALLAGNIGNNIYETVVVPAPQFYTATYQITAWAQYTQHMNQIIEKFVSSFLPQAQSWKITTSKGYWFIASMSSENFTIETNFDDMSSAERYIKCTIDLKVPAYFWLSASPGIPIPIKKYVSSPVIQFTIPQTGLPDAQPDAVEEFSNNFIIGNDDPTLPLADKPNARPDQRRTGSSLTPNQTIAQTSNPEIPVAVANPEVSSESADPAATTVLRGVKPPTYTKTVVPPFPNTVKFNTKNNEVKYAKVISSNPTTGETVYSSINDVDLTTIIVSKIE